eukprot:g6525.t1
MDYTLCPSNSTGNIDLGGPSSPEIPAFHLRENQFLEQHTDDRAYESLNAAGQTVLQSTPAFHFEPILRTSTNSANSPAREEKVRFEKARKALQKIRCRNLESVESSSNSTSIEY